jgi:hypothetical protein
MAISGATSDPKTEPLDVDFVETLQQEISDRLDSQSRFVEAVQEQVQNAVAATPFCECVGIEDLLPQHPFLSRGPKVHREHTICCSVESRRKRDHLRAKCRGLAESGLANEHEATQRLQS